MRSSVSSSPAPGGTAYAAEAALSGPRRRRALTWSRVLRGSVPYWLILPVLTTVAAILGYPLYNVIRLSFQRYQLFDLLQRKGVGVGWANYSSVLHDPVFWHTLARTIVFTVANVGLTMVLGTLLALLLVRVSTVVRVLLTSALVLAWSMPPFVVVTVYAGLAQVPDELVEAAEIDGAAPWRVFLDVTLPILRPIFLILTSLSIIWDFGVFTQPYLLIGQSNINSSNYLMSIYLFEEGYFKNDYGRGAAISILMLLCVAALSVVYVRKLIRIGDVR